MKILKHKKLIVLSIIGIILIIVAILILKMFLEPDNEPIYGNRLSNINNYKIANENITNLKTDIGALDLVDKVTYNLEGKLINIIITVDDTLTLDIFKEYANKTLEYFTAEEKAYYDIQIYGESKNDESAVYPVIGYKKNTKETIKW